MVKLSVNDCEYPFLLKRIVNPPAQLYVEGNKDILNSNIIAVVGSRVDTEYGEKWGEYFCRRLLEYDLNIVSGMALGIDSVAHWTSVREGIPTIAVLPCGFDNIYPKENEDLFKAIIDEGGAVVSEYEPVVKANSSRFIKRNRIVAGLSMGVLVVEAAYRSGTSITARMAKDSGKPVFCIPGSLDNIKSIGTNNLIKEGAIVVTEVEDIIKKYPFLKKNSLKSEFVNKNEMRVKSNLNKTHKNKIIKGDVNDSIDVNQKIDIDEIDDKYRKVYDLIPKDGVNINDIVISNNLNLSQVMEQVTMLEIMGKIKRKAGNRYSRT